MGTPSYMPPEQARGQTDRIDERADVFALGSILCEILTATPAFTGRAAAEILRKAADGDTADALARLDGCGAEAELIALAKDCLAVEPEDRPRDARSWPSGSRPTWRACRSGCRPPSASAPWPWRARSRSGGGASCSSAWPRRVCA